MQQQQPHVNPGMPSLAAADAEWEAEMAALVDAATAIPAASAAAAATATTEYTQLTTAPGDATRDELLKHLDALRTHVTLLWPHNLLLYADETAKHLVAERLSDVAALQRAVSATSPIGNMWPGAML